MPARRRSKSRTKSPRRVRRSSGGRRAPKRRTYKGTDTRLYGVAGAASATTSGTHEMQYSMMVPTKESEELRREYEELRQTLQHYFNTDDSGYMSKQPLWVEMDEIPDRSRRIRDNSHAIEVLNLQGYVDERETDRVVGVLKLLKPVSDKYQVQSAEMERLRQEKNRLSYELDDAVKRWNEKEREVGPLEGEVKRLLESLPYW